MLYLDTSIIVAALTDEISTNRMQTWLGSQQLGLLAISEWTISEFSAALSIKLRTAQTTLPARARALTIFAELTEKSFNVCPVSTDHFRTAAKFADHYTIGLRAADALHLAISADHGATLCTLDRRLAEAGNALGVQTLLL
jgi:predicted nucleic acid-binding protein